MWCRVIADDKTGQAQTMSWPRAGETSTAVLRPPGKLYPDPGQDDNVHLSEQSVAEAYQRGVRDGRAAASEQVQGKVEQLARSIEQLALHRGRIQREAEPELVKLSLAIARRILRRELTVDPDSLLGLLKAGLEKIDASETHRVRVHPEHAPVLAKLLGGAARAVDIVADPGLGVGAVVFETSRGSLDAGLESQLKEIERGFADLYPR